MHKTNQILLALLTALCVFTPTSNCHATPPTPADSKVGDYSEVQVTDKYVIAAAEFAVGPHSKVFRKVNRRQQISLKLLQIVRAEEQIVAGTNYRLTLKVLVNGSPMTAEVIVCEQPWVKRNRYRLISMELSPPP